MTPRVPCGVVCRVMSLGGRDHEREDRKSTLCEDSTDSDNEVERRALLRRISTSKCVGRLVSPYIQFFSAIASCVVVLELGRAMFRLAAVKTLAG